MSKKRKHKNQSKLFGLPSTNRMLPKATPASAASQPYKPYVPKPYVPRTYVARCRRLDFDEATVTWENWTDYDVVCGLLTASDFEMANLYTSGFGSGTLVKAKPFAGQKERFLVEDAYDAKKVTVVATPETHPSFGMGEVPEAVPFGYGRPWGGPQQAFTEVIRITELDEVGAEEHYYYLVAKGAAWQGTTSGGWQGNLWSGTSSTYEYESKNGKPLSTATFKPDVDYLDEPCRRCGRHVHDCRCTVDELNTTGTCWLCNGDFLCDWDDPRACKCDPTSKHSAGVGPEYIPMEGLRTMSAGPVTGSDGHTQDPSDDLNDLTDEDLILIGEDLIHDGEVDPVDDVAELLIRVKRWLQGEEF